MYFFLPFDQQAYNYTSKSLRNRTQLLHLSFCAKKTNQIIFMSSILFNRHSYELREKLQEKV